MRAKTLGTAALLAFVAVSIGYLAIEESKTGNDGAGSAQREPRTSARDVAAVSPEAPGLTGHAAAPSSPAEGPAQPAHKVIAYYFHSTQRCMTCNKIERWAAETLREQFATALESGELEWRVVNMEEPPNTHFVQDYQLVASSLVLVDLRDGAQRDWTNMEKVWQYVHDDEAQFKKYVAEQARAYLES